MDNVTQVIGPLEVDATRGTFLKFSIQGRQILFPRTMFDRPGLLNAAGRKLYQKLDEQGGLGVTVTGEQTTIPRHLTQDLKVNDAAIYITDVKDNPAQDPVWCPELRIALADKARKGDKDWIARENERRNARGLPTVEEEAKLAVA